MKAPYQLSVTAATDVYLASAEPPWALQAGTGSIASSGPAAAIPWGSGTIPGALERQAAM
jgi:hypothetical protein